MTVTITITINDDTTEHVLAVDDRGLVDGVPAEAVAARILTDLIARLRAARR